MLGNIVKFWNNGIEESFEKLEMEEDEHYLLSAGK